MNKKKYVGDITISLWKEICTKHCENTVSVRETFCNEGCRMYKLCDHLDLTKKKYPYFDQIDLTTC